MLSTGYKAGDEVDSKCTKCKMVLAHTILAMVGSKIAQVRCNTCGGTHTYRPPPSASEASAARRRAEKKAVALEADKQKSSAAEFDSIVRTVDTSGALPYSAGMGLELNQVIEHATFGLGVVTELREGNKAHIAFRDGGRILVYGR